MWSARQCAPGAHSRGGTGTKPLITLHKPPPCSVLAACEEVQWGSAAQRQALSGLSLVYSNCRVIWWDLSWFLASGKRFSCLAGSQKGAFKGWCIEM